MQPERNATDSTKTRTRIDALFDKQNEARQTRWDTVKSEPGQPTVKGVWQDAIGASMGPRLRPTGKAGI